MKNKIFKLMLNFFNKEIETFYRKRLDSEKESIIKNANLEKEIKAIHVNYPLNKKIIFRSNEPEPLVVGFISGYEYIHGKCYLLIRNESTGEITMPFSTNLMYYTDERFSALSKLNWAEQYNVMSKYDYQIDIELKTGEILSKIHAVDTFTKFI